VEAIDRILWRNRLGRGYGHAGKESAELMNSLNIPHVTNYDYER
jgi:hypothetical protein